MQLDRLIEDRDHTRLAFEVAKNHVGAKLPVRELLMRLQVPQRVFLECSASELFRRAVKGFVRELEESGESFRMRARIAAEDSIPVLYRIAHNDDEPGSSRIKAVEDLVRWADLEPNKNVPNHQGGPSFVINFNLPNPAAGALPGVTIEHMPHAHHIEQLSGSE